MKEIAKEVELKVAKDMPEKFVLMYDGCTSNGTHFIGIYAVYPHCNYSYYPLLALSPLLDEEAHLDFIISTLSIYNRGLDSIIFLICDNCSNKKISKLCGIPMIGCASHKFALSVTEILKDYEKEIEKVNVLLIQLRHLKNRAKLRKYTDYEPVKKNLTRWSSIYNMIGRFFQIRML